MAVDFKTIAESLREHEESFNRDGAVISEEDFSDFADSAKEAYRHLIIAMFPKHRGDRDLTVSAQDKRGDALATAHTFLLKALGYVCDNVQAAEEAADCVLNKLPYIMEMLKKDLIAAYQGDPAAKSVDEVILAYPAFTAISAYRIAHVLYEMKIPMLPRLITEFAHEKTGIDIHPGATIGAYFFIDHGTGVVIGETTIIGEHVKLYQHVTLGAKSFKVADDGSLVKGIKRHPEIGNNVTIYAGATLLGGDTIIGDNCVIGGNVWLTHSVPAGQTVKMKE